MRLAGGTLRIRGGTLKRLHINQRVLQHNRKEGTRWPIYTVITSRFTYRAASVTIEGPSEFVYSPDKPLSCGATVWVETRAPVELKGAGCVHEDAGGRFCERCESALHTVLGWIP